MRPTMLLLAMALLAGPADAGDVYVSRDAKGNVIYTDTPQTIPAQKLDVRSASSDPAQVQARYDEQMKRYAADDAADAKAAATAANAKKAAALTAEDRAKRCIAERERYQATMNAIRVYEEGPDGQRRYLSSEEIDTARANARKAMDEFCNPE